MRLGKRDIPDRVAEEVSMHPALKWTGLFLASAAVLLFFLFFFGERRSFQPYAATVNGEKIYVSELEERMEQEVSLLAGFTPLTGEEFELFRDAVLAVLINEKLLLQRARALNITVSDDELESRLGEWRRPYTDAEWQKIEQAKKTDPAVAREELRKTMIIDKLVDREVLSRLTVDEEEFRHYFQSRRQKYAAYKTVRVSQIVVRRKPAAERAWKRLKAGEPFASVARDISLGPEAVKGGDMGYLEAGSMPEEFEKAAFTLPVGKSSGIIKTIFGYHIIMVTERSEPGSLVSGSLRHRVMADLRRDKQEAAYQQWIAGLRAKAVINIRDNDHGK